MIHSKKWSLAAAYANRLWRAREAQRNIRRVNPVPMSFAFLAALRETMFLFRRVGVPAMPKW
ncbi:MAG: hypothetical protein H6Q48_1116 [Deltaproteobacteria bacterium]|jgi:hypothetical protein|nr:hypothetical protein [Deltaproteobacteria bacterium]